MKATKETRFYGWTALAGCILCMFLVQGTIQTFAVFMPQIVAETGWSLSQVAQVSTFASTSGFFANLLLSRVLKRIKVKTVLLIGTVFLAFSFLIYSP